MPSDELIGNVFQIIAHHLRLRADVQNIVANALDQRCLPPRRDGAERVPCMAGDEAEAGRPNRKFFLDMAIGFARWFVMLHAVRTEPPLKEIDDSTMFELAGLNLEQIVRESKEPKSCIAQLA